MSRVAEGHHSPPDDFHRPDTFTDLSGDPTSDSHLHHGPGGPSSELPCSGRKSQRPNHLDLNPTSHDDPTRIFKDLEDFEFLSQIPHDPLPNTGVTGIFYKDLADELEVLNERTEVLAETRNSSDVDRMFTSPLNIPNASRCSAFGPGLQLGQVLVKNNFQVTVLLHLHRAFLSLVCSKLQNSGQTGSCFRHRHVHLSSLKAQNENLNPHNCNELKPFQT